MFMNYLMRTEWKNNTMGYYTDYTLQILNLSDDKKKDVFSRLSLNSDGESNSKWYSHENDMKNISKMIDFSVFILHGIGEDNDCWVKIFCDGNLIKCIIGRIVYDDLDEYIEQAKSLTKINLEKFNKELEDLEYQKYLELKNKFELNENS